MTQPRAKFQEAVWIALVLVLALVRYYTSPTIAAAALTIPDGEEYAVTAHRFATLGQFNIVVDNVVHPTRYPPAFSLFLSPIYHFFPNHIGNGIFLVLFFNLIGAFSAYVIGRTIASPLVGLTTAVAVIFEPLLSMFAREIQTDAPVVSLILLTLALLLQWPLRSSPRARILLAMGMGLAIGVASAFRPLELILLPPLGFLLFLQNRRSSARSNVRSLTVHFALLALPTLLAALGTALYNKSIFGFYSRTGYHYWVPLPYEFPDLVFSFRYIDPNLNYTGRLLFIWAALALVGLVLLRRCKIAQLPTVALFWLLIGVPLSCVYCCYFFPDERLHLGFAGISVALAGAGIGAFIEFIAQDLAPAKWPTRRPWMTALVALLGLGIYFRWPAVDRVTLFQWLAECMRNETPENAILITRMTPVVLEPTVLRGTHRRWVATSRDQEYADKAIAPHPLKFRAPNLTWPGSHTSPGLFAAGATLAVSITAADSLAALKIAVQQGRPVYIDILSARSVPYFYTNLERDFSLEVERPNSPLRRLAALPLPPNPSP